MGARAIRHNLPHIRTPTKDSGPYTAWCLRAFSKTVERQNDRDNEPPREKDVPELEG